MQGKCVCCICSQSVPILYLFCIAQHAPPPSPSQRDATPRTNTAAGYITAGYITDPDTHGEQRGPLSDFWVPGRLPGGSREAKEGAAPCAPCRTPCTSGRPPRAPTAGLTCPGCGETSLGSVYCILIILDDFSLGFNDFDKYAVTKRWITARQKYIWAQNELGGLAPGHRHA